MMRATLALACGFGAGTALAAGGHHAVDDAEILKRGDCEGEGWFTRARGGERLLHSGLQCRVGPVELGAAAEYGRADGASQTGWALELKWAREVADGFSLGISVAPSWQAHVRPRHDRTTLNGLASWAPHEQWAFHANLGREFNRGGQDEARYGVAAEWKPRPGWSLLAERYREEATHFVRAGVRWEAGRRWTIDFSRAQRLSGVAPSNWTVGLTIDLDDD
jgi:hypothetical protein